MTPAVRRSVMPSSLASGDRVVEGLQPFAIDATEQVLDFGVAHPVGCEAAAPLHLGHVGSTRYRVNSDGGFVGADRKRCFQDGVAVRTLSGVKGGQHLDDRAAVGTGQPPDPT